MRQSLHQNHNFMVITKKAQNLTYRGSRLEAEYQVLVKSTLNINFYVFSLFYMSSPVAFKVSKLCISLSLAKSYSGLVFSLDL